MTTGDRITDLRYTDAHGVPKSLGKLFSKRWSGGDSSTIVKAQKHAKAAWPGFWHDYKAKYASYFSSCIVLDGRGRATPHSIKELIRRHRSVYAEYRARMDAYIILKSKVVSLRKEASARALEQHNYTCTIVQSNDVPCSWRRKLGDAWGAWQNNVSASAAFGNIVGPKACWSANDDNALLEQLRSKLNGVPGFHAGVMIAELEKTVKFFGATAVTLRLFGSLMSKPGRTPDALRVLYNGLEKERRDNTIKWDGIPRSAQIYLGYQFGLKPLLEDVKSAAQMLGWQAGYSKTSRIRVRRRQKSSSRSQSPVVMGWDRVETGQIIAYLTEAPRDADFSGLTDLASILWERQWMSFVVDWWIPVGAALSALQLSQVLTGQFVTTRVTRDTRTNYSSATGPKASWQVIGDSSSRRTITVKRVVSSNLIPKLPKLKPIFHPDLDVRLRHTLEAGSLMIVQRHKIIKAVRWLSGDKHSG